MIETLNRFNIEKTYFNIIKAMYDKHTANILNSEILKASPLRSETKNTLTQHSVISPSQCNQRTQTNKRIQMRMKVKLSLFTDDTVSHIENSKDSTKNC